MKHLNIIITGLVQGVCFRARTLEKAKELGVRGFVRNEADGSVLIEAEGGDDALQVFVDWVNVGPERAEVGSVSVEEGELVSYSNFVIDRS